MDPDILQARVHQAVGSLVSVTRRRVGEPLVEMGSKTVNKGRILEKFAARHGIEAHEVMARLVTCRTTRRCSAGRVKVLRWRRVSRRSLRRWGRTCPPFHEDGVAQTIEAMLAEWS